MAVAFHYGANEISKYFVRYVQKSLSKFFTVSIGILSPPTVDVSFNHKFTYFINTMLRNVTEISGT